MPSRPTEPTSALAALIAGNHRHVERLQAAAPQPADAESNIAFPQNPFALALVEPGPIAVTPRIFASAHSDVIMVDSVQALASRATQHQVRLIVAIQPINSQLAQMSSTWQYAEHRAFASVELILRTTPHLRRLVSRGEVRIVAALLEDATERVHWIGEHPEIDLLVRDG